MGNAESRECIHSAFLLCIGDTLRLEEDLSNFLGATVRIDTNKKGKGKLIIEFSDLDQFDGIIAHFGNFD